VILRGSQIIGNSNLMIKQIFTPRENGKKIPFTLLTNGGGFVEERKAEEINSKLHLDQEDPKYRMHRGHII
jgi:ribonucleotide monophosphatase NagD (HAD superfamily)